MFFKEIAIRKARFTEHQIIAVLKSVETGRTVKDVCREAGISEASNYSWKAKCGGMEASDIKKMFAALSIEFGCPVQMQNTGSGSMDKHSGKHCHVYLCIINVAFLLLSILVVQAPAKQLNYALI